MKYNIAFPYFSKTDIEEILSKYREILTGNGLMTMGRYVQGFEQNFADFIHSKYAVATNSCTSALEIALQTIGINENAEVIIPTQTFFATGSSIIACGGKVVFCETDNNFLIDFEDLKQRITPRTKVVIIVHFAGLIHPDITQIKSYLKKRDIFLIEDCAHAHGAKIGNSFAGTIGDIGCFSFYSTKIMTTGEGGMLCMNDENLYQLSKSLRSRGVDISADEEIFISMGSNHRVTEFQAILGIYQIKRLEEFVTRRNQIAHIYKDTLSSLYHEGIINFQNYNEAVTRHAYWRFVIFLNDKRIQREKLRHKMKESGIAIDWPYTPLLHLQPAFKKLYGFENSSFPKTEKLARRHFCLPVHYMIEKDDAKFISEKLKDILQCMV